MKRALLLLLLASPALADQFGPFGSKQHPVTREVPHARPPADPRPLAPTTFWWMSYGVYRHAISPIDGPRCMHRPTCSRYALLAVQKHPFAGLLLSVDRLWRSFESSGLRRLPMVVDGETVYFEDPLEESDSWFRPPSR